MDKKTFIRKMLELGAELDQSDNTMQHVMIIDQAEDLYDEHLLELDINRIRNKQVNS